MIFLIAYGVIVFMVVSIFILDARYQVYAKNDWIVALLLTFIPIVNLFALLLILNNIYRLHSNNPRRGIGND